MIGRLRRSLYVGKSTEYLFAFAAIFRVTDMLNRS